MRVGKVRVYELAKQLGLPSKEAVTRLKRAGIDVKSHSSSVDEAEAKAALKAGTKAQPRSEGKVARAHAVKGARAVAKPQTAGPKKTLRSPRTKEGGTAVAGAPAMPKAPPKPAPHPGVAREEPKTPARPVPPGAAAVKPAPRPTPVAPRREEPPPPPRIPAQPKVEAPAVLLPAVPEVKEPAPPPEPKVVRIPETVTVKELSGLLQMSSSDLIKRLIKVGIVANVNQSLNADVIAAVAEKLGFRIEMAPLEVADEVDAETEDPALLRPRAPVVTVMGHVDHGKTSLLDAIRHTNVIAQEAGGITQHIGAYEVEITPDPGRKFPGGRVVFLDTPGHEAFTAMRARGTQVTDFVILVVAADDGVMPQTVEAVNHARDAGVPILVAVNKIDKPGSDPGRIRQQLADRGLLPEEWGGQTIFVDVSAKKRIGIEELLGMIVLQSEILELKANPAKRARGVVVEAKLDRGRGPVATVLVQQGTLRVGDNFAAGRQHGRVRALVNDRGRKVHEAPPSTPVEVLGLSGVPEPGDTFIVVAEERKARQIAMTRLQRQRDKARSVRQRVTLDDLHQRIEEGELKEVRIVLKGDVQGSVEALRESLERLSTDQVKLKVIHAGVGAIAESDVMLASASNAIVLGFNVRPSPNAERQAEEEGVDLRLHSVIYDAVGEIRKAMEGLLEPEYVERAVGHAEVRNLFTVPKVGTVAGAYVSEGKVIRDGHVRLIRDGRLIHTGKIGSLRRFKEDVREVQSGLECGIGVHNYGDLKVGDVLEVYELTAVSPKLQPMGTRP
ncbi:MAG: translation initiation factor IF-2 [Candidatus Methylomirabilales bacterium]